MVTIYSQLVFFGTENDCKKYLPDIIKARNCRAIVRKLTPTELKVARKIPDLEVGRYKKVWYTIAASK